MTAGTESADPAGQPSAPASSSLLSAGADSCPTCGKPMAKDQRYCLECGNRRGDPRLPFMDAVVFMEASRQPEAAAEAAAPPPRESKGGISNNTALVAGVATLVLAIGVGVLIGRSGESNSQPVANTTPQVIKVEGGGGGGGSVETSSGSSGSSAKQGGGSSKSKSKGSSKAKSSTEEGAHGGSVASEEVLKPSANAKEQAKAETKVGDTCTKGSAGCNGSGEFDGSFFGE